MAQKRRVRILSRTRQCGIRPGLPQNHQKTHGFFNHAKEIGNKQVQILPTFCQGLSIGVHELHEVQRPIHPVLQVFQTNVGRGQSCHCGECRPHQAVRSSFEARQKNTHDKTKTTYLKIHQTIFLQKQNQNRSHQTVQSAPRVGIFNVDSPRRQRQRWQRHRKQNLGQPQRQKVSFRHRGRAVVSLEQQRATATVISI